MGVGGVAGEEGRWWSSMDGKGGREELKEEEGGGAKSCMVVNARQIYQPNGKL